MNANTLLSSLAPFGFALAVAMPAAAQNPVQFQNGQTADATAVNGNFTLINGKAVTAQATADTALATASQLTAGLTVLGNGNVGVGISPVSRLHVNGDLICAPTLGNTLRLIGSNDNTSLLHYTANEAVAGMLVDGWTGQARGSLTFVTRGVGMANYQSRLSITEDGFVGVANATPTARLDITGDMRLSSTLRFGGDNENGDPVQIFRAAGNPEESVLIVRCGNDGSSLDRVDFLMGTGGGVTYQFLGNGSAFKPGGGSWSSISDARKKKNIRPRTGTLAQLLQLHGKTFEYIDPSSAGTGPGVHTGFIAQEVQTVFPEWVSTLEDGTKYLAISGFEALTVEALRELDARNGTLVAEGAELRASLAAKDGQIGELQSKNVQLEARLESLADQLAALQAQVQPLLAK